ncbi:MAG: DUF3341 domain-containing protein [Bacteroidales bacterium]|nr:DUF3341 domain-containing protein [Bacteroidales bacterium]
MNTPYISAWFDDDEKLLSGLKVFKEKGIKIADVLTPFPVHGIDKVLGYRRSWIARVGFIGGVLGAASALVFQAWVFTKSYPLNIGGKPFFALPSFIPVTFELTVLFAAFAMVFAFLIRSKLGPGAKTEIYDERITDDRFVVLVDINENHSEENIKKISAQMAEAGAMDIKIKLTENK